MKEKSNSASKDVRKIVQVGNAWAVTLPVEYFEKTNVEKGGKVELIFNEKGVILIQPVSGEKISDRMKGVSIGV